MQIEDFLTIISTEGLVYQDIGHHFTQFLFKIIPHCSSVLFLIRLYIFLKAVVTTTGTSS